MVTVEELRRGFADPPPDARPMMRWWWFGPAVDRKELDRELVAMAAAGIGGVEAAFVYPLSPVGDGFGSEAFLGHVRFAARRAHELGLRFDLTLGSGWSYGGAHIGPELAARRLHWDRREIGGSAAEIPAGPPGHNAAAPGALSAPGAPSAPGVSAALGVSAGSGSAATGISGWPGDELVAAYIGAGASGEPRTYTELVIADGTIEIPEGSGPREVLIAYARPTGQNVKRAAVGAEGPVLDHYSAAASAEHIRCVAEPLLAAATPELVGSVFCDSLEVYGADWTRGIFDEFAQRRGYDLRPWLYLLAVDGDRAGELRRDFYRTLSELYEQNFLSVFQRWASSRGVPFRIQSYGEPPATMSSYRFADGYEGEGWDWQGLPQTRWASSAASLYGKDVVSAEAWTWVHSPSFRATPLDLKGEAHEHFLAGVNHLIGHGWPYSPPDAPGLGWFFYAAGALDDRNPWWPAAPELFGYLRRLCWLLRQGRPVRDVQVYVPASDVYARMGPAAGGRLDLWRGTRQHIGADIPRVVREAGLDFDLIDDDAIALGRSGDASVVVVAYATALPAATYRRLEDVAAGGSVIAVASPAAPASAVHLADVTGLREALGRAVGPDVSLTPEGAGVGVVHRRLDDADVYFVANTTGEPREVRFAARGAVGRGDAATGARDGVRPWYGEWDARTGRVRRGGRVGDGIELRLHPYEATVIVLSSTAPAVPAAGGAVPRGAGEALPPVLPGGAGGPVPLDAGGAVPWGAGEALPRERPPRELERRSLDGPWRVRFADGNGTPEPVTLPHRWEDHPGRAAYSGAASYETEIQVDDAVLARPDVRVRLDFGEGGKPDVTVGGPSVRANSFRAQVTPPIGVVGEVGVNGERCGVLWAPPYVIDLTERLRPGTNTLRVTVYNTAANALSADRHIHAVVEDATRRYGRRFTMQELDRAADTVASGLLAVPTLAIADRSRWK